MTDTFFHVFKNENETNTATLRKYVNLQEGKASYLVLYAFGDLEQWADGDE